MEHAEEHSVWLRLPVEVVLEVFRWLGPESLLRAEAACSQWRAITGPGSPHGTALWRSWYEQHFGGPMPAEMKALTKLQPKPEASWRTWCLSCLRTRRRLAGRARRRCLLEWILACGHHAALRRLVAPASPDRGVVTRLLAGGWAEPGERRTLPLMLAVLKGRDPRTIELVVELGVEVEWCVVLKAARAGAGEALFRAMARREELMWFEPSVGGALEQAFSRSGGSMEAAFHAAYDNRRREVVASPYKGRIAFERACVYGWTSAFHALLPLLSPADLRRPSALDGWSPLMLALRCGDVEMARTLLDLGVPPDLDEGCSSSPLDVACRSSQSPNKIALVMLLLDYGADVDEPDLLETAGYLTELVGESRYTSYERKLEVVKLLLARQPGMVRGQLWGALLDALLEGNCRYNNRARFIRDVLGRLFAYGAELPAAVKKGSAPRERKWNLTPHVQELLIAHGMPPPPATATTAHHHAKPPPPPQQQQQQGRGTKKSNGMRSQLH
ncbi:F-box domain containing protein [Acanthamoeba castellanii str. Neff]|uniref:F-box domain containing protein n=1 Tax=Acanthamoeba castellanii (strain ATCC 30010 / Neff) TaxID=1257118 RepID=L8GE92_ACACF|nr:F-box domain containing protein [Acanthamoeba castellanii str. Neff]ELR11159.1 F-box domain containing protein [Acanthamoeba castellanii str. Neff]